MLNTSARLIFDLRRSDHITDALASLHWLCVPERITSMTKLLTFRALRGEAPQYLSEKLVRVADISSRRRLRSSSTSQLMLPRYQLSIVDSRSFFVARPTIWNQLPLHRVFLNSSGISKHISSFWHFLGSTFLEMGLLRTTPSKIVHLFFSEGKSN